MTSICLSTLILILAQPPSPTTHPSSPRQYLVKLDTKPDFCQVDDRFGPLPGGGESYCAPITIVDGAIVFSVEPKR